MISLTKNNVTKDILTDLIKNIFVFEFKRYIQYDSESSEEFNLEDKENEYLNSFTEFK